MPSKTMEGLMKKWGAHWHIVTAAGLALGGGAALRPVRADRPSYEAPTLRATRIQAHAATNG